jgi:ribonuclease-3
LPGSDEGDLTRVRAHLVREDSLHRVALQLGLPEVLRLSEGEAAAAARSAVHPGRCAGGADRRGVPRRRLRRGASPGAAPVRRGDRRHRQASWSKDAKTELQEWLQARRMPVPAYRIVATRGQAHAQTFEVECAVPTLGLAEHGEGRSRRRPNRKPRAACSTR